MKDTSENQSICHYTLLADNKPICETKMKRIDSIDDVSKMKSDDIICPMCQMELDALKSSGRFHDLSIEESSLVIFFSRMAYKENKCIGENQAWNQIRNGEQPLSSFFKLAGILNKEDPLSVLKEYDFFRESYIKKYSDSKKQ